VLPATTEPFNEASEKELVAILMNEIQGNIAVKIDCNPKGSFIDLRLSRGYSYTQ
jgi:hypothetical protein